MIFEQTAPVINGERSRQFFSFFTMRWDIDKALALVEGREANGCIDPTEAANSWLGPQQLPGQDYETLMIGLINVNVPHALSERVDITKPLIAVRASIAKGQEEFVIIIDGWHRIWRGRYEQIDRLPVHMLTKAEDKACRL